MTIIRTTLFSLLLTLFLIMPTTVLAGTIGDLCEKDSDCDTQKCLESNLKTEKNKFCVCDTAAHCEAKYKKSEPTEVWTCDKSLAPKSNNLPFCQSDKQGIKTPVSTEVLAAATAASTSTAPTDVDGETIKLKPPTMAINIPGLKKWDEIEVVAGKTAQIPYIALYVVGIYKYALIIGSILATTMIMIGGIMYMSAAGSTSRISTAKNTIFGAISGIILLLGSYLILVSINPNLVHFSGVHVDTLKEPDTWKLLIEETTLSAPLISASNLDISPQGVPSSKGHIKCNSKNQPIDVKTGKLINEDKLRGNRGHLFYEVDHGISLRNKRDGTPTKYSKPDMVVIHSTAGTSFLKGANSQNAETKGPATHYLIDRNGDIVQTALEENIAWTNYGSPNGIGKEAAKRSISFEIVNLNRTCGKACYYFCKSRPKRTHRYSGENYTKGKPNFWRCQSVTPPTTTETRQAKCDCDPNISGYVATTNKENKKCYEVFPQVQVAAVVDLTARIAATYDIPVKHAVTKNFKLGIPNKKSKTGTCPSANREKYCWDLGPGIIGHADIQENSHGDPGPAWDWDTFIAAVAIKKAYYKLNPSANKFSTEEEIMLRATQ